MPAAGKSFKAFTAGNLITIDHGDGLVTKYMHHSEMYVKVGDHVEKGQQIGLSGSTGNSTGNHLHFQVEENGVAVNPLLYLQGNGTSSELQRKNPMEDIVSGTKVVLAKKDSEDEDKKDSSAAPVLGAKTAASETETQAEAKNVSDTKSESKTKTAVQVQTKTEAKTESKTQKQTKNKKTARKIIKKKQQVDVQLNN